MESKTPSRRRARDRARTQLTERDRVLLEFAAEHRLVLAAQVANLVGIGVAAADARLRLLTARGYLRRERHLHLQPAAHLITRAGLGAVQSELPAPRRVELATYRHDVGLGWLMVAAARGRFGPLQAIVGERRMRSRDGRDPHRPDRWGVRLGGVGPGGRERLHYPDLVLVDPVGRRVAFELELSSKSPRARERILAAYAADRRIDSVVYLVDDVRAGRAIERSARRVGASEIVRVQAVTLSPGRCGDLGAERTVGLTPRAAAAPEGRAL